MMRDPPGEVIPRSRPILLAVGAAPGGRWGLDSKGNTMEALDVAKGVLLAGGLLGAAGAGLFVLAAVNVALIGLFRGRQDD